MSGTTGTIPLNTVVADQLITSAERNAELANIGSLMDASGCGGHSDTDSDAQIQTNPYPGSVLSKATSIAGELERLRYVIAQILGKTYWYQPADSGNNLGSIFISGEIKAFGGSSVPTGFLACDGTSYLRTDYPSLFSAIGTAWGSADGTHFNVPDLRGKALYGKDSGSLFTNIGSTGGTQDHTHTGPAHTHTVDSHTHTTPDTSHSHYLSASGSQGSVNYTAATKVGVDANGHQLRAVAAGGGETVNWMTNLTDVQGSTGVSGATSPGTDSQGTGNTGTANPPFATVLYIIKT